MRKLIILAVTLVGLVSFTQQAWAEPEVPIIKGSITVKVQGSGKVTGTGIDCGSDCAENASWKETEMPPKNRLTATANPGWAFSAWSGCVPVNGQPQRCDATYLSLEIGGDPVIATFADVQAPVVVLKQPAAGTVAGGSLPADVEATDNDRIARVEYLVDGTVVRNEMSSTKWDVALDVSGLAEGEHELRARAFDRAGNSATTAARVFTVDHTGPAVTLNSPVEATNEARPRFSFDSNSVDFASAACGIQRPGPDQERHPCNRNEWFEADAPAEGDWEFVVDAIDSLGNHTVVRHPFKVDRSAPVLAFTAGPADGSEVEIGNVNYRWTVDDDLPVVQLCSWDNGEELPCRGSAGRGLPRGTHIFQVKATDAAGNRTLLTRTVHVKKDGNLPDDPDPDGDRIAPKVKLVAVKSKLRKLSRGLKLRVRCSEACAGRVKASGKRGLVFKGKAKLGGAGTKKVVLKPTGKTRKKLRSLVRKRVRLILTAKAALRDRAGNTGRAALRIDVRR